MGKRVNPMAVKSALTYEVGEAAAALGVTPATIRNWIKDGLPVMASQKPYLISGAELREYLRQKYRDAKSPLGWNELYCTSCRVGRAPHDMAATIAPITAKTSLIKGCCSECHATATRMIATAKASEWAEVFHVTKGDHSEAYMTPSPPLKMIIQKEKHPMRKLNEQNERIKRKYLQYLKRAQRKDITTVHKAAEGILRFEASTHFIDFKAFRIDQVIKFQDRLESEVNKQTGKPLSKSTIRSILSANKGFFFWLAGQNGYKSRIRHSDADYFNMDAKGARVASAVRETPYPSMEMARHAFSYMPEATEIDRRNKALFAFFMLTGARDGAVASLRLKHINMIDGCVYQDARDVKTKNAKTFTTYFLSVDPDYLEAFAKWVAYLRNEKLFGPDDALFPPPDCRPVDGVFTVTGLKRPPYKNANAIRQVIKEAFTRADLPAFTPHAFRKTLVKWADTHFPTREAFKAFSQNIGHTSVITTVSAYCPVSIERQAELIKGAPGE